MNLPTRASQATAEALPALVERGLAVGAADLAERDPAIGVFAERERLRQATHVNLVAASSPTLPAVLLTQALGFSSVTAEGYPGARYHPGADVIDAVERLAIERATSLFGADHANVQALSASAANLALLSGLLEPGESVLSLDLSHGGHLSHASPPSSMSKWIDAHYYRLTSSGLLDPDEIRRQALETKPRVIICGGSAYPRLIDFQVMRSVADDVGALLLGDISHISGLVAAGIHPSPFPHCDLVTTSTYKQLCGPHGGIVLRAANSRVSGSRIDRMVFPGLQGTPDFGMIAAKAVAFGAALGPEFTVAMRRVAGFAAIVADVFNDQGLALLSGGTDTHMVLVDLRPQGITGRDASDALEEAGILANKNLIPDDPRRPAETSGLRFGTNHLAFMTIDDAGVRALATDVARVLLHLAEPSSPASHQAIADLTAHVADLTGDACRATDGAPTP